MRPKTKLEYVDEFRKISTLQKLQPIDNLWVDLDNENKGENNKFIRLKDQYEGDEMKINLPSNWSALENDLITAYKKDIQEDCLQDFIKTNQQITNVTKGFKTISDQLTTEIKKPYKHTFKYQDATPPVRLHQQSISEGALKTTLLNLQKMNAEEREKEGDQKEKEKVIVDDDDEGLGLPQKGKYNFAEISRLHSLHVNESVQPSLSTANDFVKSEFARFRKYRTIDQIDNINQFQQGFSKYQYDLEPSQPVADIQWVENSILKQKASMNIDLFRDIGKPSRNILEYVRKNYMKDKQLANFGDLIVPPLTANNLSRQKQQTLFLFFLHPQELRINKSKINFHDLSNISTGRITPYNASMCIQSQKITRAQVNKLQARLERYSNKIMEGGKKKEDAKVGGDEEGEDKIEIKQEEGENDEDFATIIDTINKIRKERQIFQKADNENTINQIQFKNEIITKLTKLLDKLYESVLQSIPRRYSLHQIGSHLDELQGNNALGYQNIRVLWYIASVYHEVLNAGDQEVNVRNVERKNRETSKGTKVITWKGGKIVKIGEGDAKKIYGFGKTRISNTVLQQQKKTAPI